jgi:hypothetical protein
MIFLMPWLHRAARLLVLALLLVVGCTPQIGDTCTVSTDCSQLGDRLCDASQPDGYCTVFNCEPDTCPTDGNGVCVAFFPQLDPACGGADSAQSPRFERTFCMRGCDSDSDCRSGYACVAPSDPSRNAQIVDAAPAKYKVCMVASELPPPTSTAVPGICKPSHPDIPLTPYQPGAGGASGASGAGGASGASGAGGAGGAK